MVNSKNLFNQSSGLNAYNDFMLVATDYSTRNIKCSLTSHLIDLMEIEIVDSSKYSDCVPAQVDIQIADIHYGSRLIEYPVGHHKNREHDQKEISQMMENRHQKIAAMCL